MGIATDLLDRTGIESKKVKWFFMAFLIYIILNIVGVTDKVPILDGLKISAASSGYAWIYGGLIVVFILLMHEDAM